MILSVLVVSGLARAQSAEAEALFNSGNELMAGGKLTQACEAFEASNRVEPRAGTLIRLGECREQNQQFASAWSAYKDALARVKDPRKREFAMIKAAELESRLSYLTVSISDRSRIGGLILVRNGRSFDPMLWNRPLPVDGGDYIIAGRAPDHEEWQTVAHVPMEGARVSVEVPTLVELSKLALPLPPLASKSPTIDPHDGGVRQSRGVFTTKRKISIGVAGASVVGVVVGVVLGASAMQKQNDAYKVCPDPAMPCTQADRSNALIQSSHSRALEANIAFSVAAAATIGAGVLWFTGAPDAENTTRISMAPSLAPGETSFVVIGRF